MAVLSKVLLESKYLENTQTTQYTAVGVTALIDKWTITNTTTGIATVDINLVPSGGSPTNSNIGIWKKVIQGGETYVCELAGHTLRSGDYISTISSPGSALACRISGREIS